MIDMNLRQDTTSVILHILQESAHRSANIVGKKVAIWKTSVGRSTLSSNLNTLQGKRKIRIKRKIKIGNQGGQGLEKKV